MRKPYVIISPDYDYTSGGIKVMWGLFGWLLTKGVQVYMNRYPAGEIIAIYPEIFHGNSTGANTVVRYILNRPGVMGSRGRDGSFTAGPTSFDPNDKLYYFSRLFGKAEDENHYLFLPIIDLHTFRDQKKKRTKKVVFYGKGRDLGLHPKDCIVIDRTVAQDQQVLADLLNECEVMYCYDPVTAMTETARLCGCRVVIFPSTYTKKEYSQYECGMNGISWGKDEGVKLDTEVFTSHYREMINLFSKRLDIFINQTQK